MTSHVLTCPVEHCTPVEATVTPLPASSIALRANLVRADGLGNLELVLQTGDRVRDET